MPSSLAERTYTGTCGLCFTGNIRLVAAENNGLPICCDCWYFKSEPDRNAPGRYFSKAY